MSVHDAYHIYATLRVAAKSTSTWVGEVAITGHRFAVQGGTQHGLDEGNVSLGLFHAQDASVSRSTAAWNILQGWAGVSGDGTHEVTDGDKDGIVDEIGTFFNVYDGITPDDYEVQDIRVYAIGSDGRAVTAPDIYTPTSSMPGLVSGQWPGPQAAMVVSTQSATLGRKGRGRFYVGPLGNTWSSDGLLGSSERAAVLAGAKTMFDNIRNIGSPASARYAPIVWHRGTTQGSIINAVRMGDETDTQQRRRRQRKETYSSSNLA